MTNQNKRIWLSVALASLLLAGCGESTGQRHEEAQRHITRTEVYLEQGQYRAAYIEARNAVRLAPELDDSVTAMANLMARMGDHRGVIEFLNERPELTTEHQKLLATAYTRIGKFRSAGKLVDAIPDAAIDLDWQLLRARSLSGTGELDQADALLTTLQEQNPDSGEVALERARLALLQQQAPRAKQLLERALELDRKNSETWFTLATLQLQQNTLDEAATSLTEALANTIEGDMLTAERSRILRVLVDVLSQMGRSDEALIYQRLLAESNPELMENQQQLTDAVELYRQGDLASAESILSELYQGNPDNDASALLLGMINFQNQEFDQASDLFADHLDTELASPQVISAAAVARLQLRQSDAALALLEEALDSHPESAELWSLYGLVLLNSADDSDKGLLAMQKALALDPDRHRLRIALANYHSNRQNYAQASAQLQTILQRDPDNAAAQTRYLALLAQQQKFTEANNFIDGIAKRAGAETTRVLMFRAVVAETQGDNKSVEQLLKRAIANDAKDVGPVLALAQHYARNKQWQQAADNYRDAMARDPNQIAVYQGLISSHEQLGDVATALQTLSAQANDGSNDAARAVLIDYHVRNNQLAAATPLIEQGGAPQGRYQTQVWKRFYRLQGTAAARDGNSDGARDSFDAGLALDPDDMELLALRSRLHLLEGEFDAATAIADKMTTLPGGRAFAEELRGDIAVQQDQFEIAIVHFRNAWESRPAPLLGRKLMSLLRRTGATEEAIRFGADWAQRLPNDAAAKLHYANQLQQSGDCKRAAPLFAELAESETGTRKIVATNNLANCYLALGDARAVEAARAAYDIAPELAAVIDTYGWILFKSGQRERGLELLEQALEKDPENSEIAAHVEAARRG